MHLELEFIQTIINDITNFCYDKTGLVIYNISYSLYEYEEKERVFSIKLITGKNLKDFNINLYGNLISDILSSSDEVILQNYIIKKYERYKTIKDILK